MKSAASFCAFALLLCSSAFAASPFDGVWKLDTSKSHLAGDTLTYADAGSGSLKYTDSAETYTFKTDGSPFTTPYGTVMTFTKTGEGSYTLTSKMGDVLLRTTTLTVSSDGKQLTEEATGTKPNGDSFDNVATYIKTTQGRGLIGTWKSTKVKVSSPNSLTIQTDGSDGVTLALSAMKASCQAKWGGMDFPVVGPTVPDGLTLSLSKAGSSGFKLVQKIKGKAILIAHYQLSPDGKTLNMRATDGQGKEPFSEVFEKQG